VRQVLDTIEEGGAIEGYVRIGLLMAKAGRGRRYLSQMESVRKLVAPAHLLDGVGEDEFRRLMHEETIVVEFEPDRAKRALPKLLRSAADRRHAHELLDVMTSHFKLEEAQRTLAAELKALLPVVAAPRKAARKPAARKPATRKSGNRRRASGPRAGTTA
jgi:hypothetical protein